MSRVQTRTKVDDKGPVWLARSIATWFGCGLAPFAPGTVGSLAGLAMAYVLHEYAGWRPISFGVLGILLLPLGVWAGNVESTARGKKDPGQVVVDEVAGQWITLAGALMLNWKSWAGAFVLFRLLDIWKPAPARQLESLPGGIGIMADDAVAGLYGASVLFLAGHLNLY